MPIHWTISHPERLVLVACEGSLTRADIETYLDDVVVDGAMPYRKLFELAGATLGLADGDMMALGARIQAYVRTMPDGMGPLAIVAPTDGHREQAQMFAALAVGPRQVKIFSDAPAARKWLDSFTVGS